MIKLPPIIIMLLPEKWKKKQIKLHWDEFTDQQIINSYRDDVKWIDAISALYDGEPSSLLDNFKTHLNEFVIPQMIERGLRDE